MQQAAARQDPNGEPVEKKEFKKDDDEKIEFRLATTSTTKIDDKPKIEATTSDAFAKLASTTVCYTTCLQLILRLFSLSL